MQIRAVLFDIDGTLIDSVNEHVISWALAFQTEGFPQEEDDLRRQIGKGGDLLIPALLPDADEALTKRISDGHGALFKSIYLDQVRPFPGAAALVKKVSAGGRTVALASSSSAKEVAHYVHVLGVQDAVAATVSIDDVAKSKPSPDIFSTALDKLGVAAIAAIVVGDTPYDMTAALSAGIAAIGVMSGPFSEQDLKDAGATAVYANVGALLDQLDVTAINA